jgi:hypothetical protein
MNVEQTGMRNEYGRKGWRSYIYKKFAIEFPLNVIELCSNVKQWIV